MTVSAGHPSRLSAGLQAFTHDDYLDYSAVRDAFVSVDACFFCLGRGHASKGRPSAS